MQLEHFLHAVYQHKMQLTPEAYFLPTAEELRTMALETGITEEEYADMLQQAINMRTNGEAYFKSKAYVEAYTAFNDALRYTPYDIQLWAWKSKCLAILAQIQASTYSKLYLECVEELQLIAQSNPSWASLAAQHTADKHKHLQSELTQAKAKRLGLFVGLAAVCLIVGGIILFTSENAETKANEKAQLEAEIQTQESNLQSLELKAESLGPDGYLQLKYEIEGAKNRIRIAKEKLFLMNNE